MARLSLAWTVAAGAILAFVPMSTVSESGASSTGAAYSRTYQQTLIDSQGRFVLVVLAVPIVLAAVGAFAWGRATLPARVVAASLLGIGCLLGMASIGLFYLPALALMIGAAVRTANADAARV